MRQKSNFSQLRKQRSWTFCAGSKVQQWQLAFVQPEVFEKARVRLRISNDRLDGEFSRHRRDNDLVVSGFTAVEDVEHPVEHVGWEVARIAHTRAKGARQGKGRIFVLLAWARPTTRHCAL